ncbi:hypothetical protein [Clostridium tagluense]|uniref:hypothetical protein n=1 Tax=Clostridium tagluense TaxID=360422 RepID=UPI001C6E482E|nr:hypothetical protein [Clostridium tagluense]MBW9158996.1 hypothetical protein [Clostridium tagluense]WLC68386.1 hypothetical protein KTC93_24940 [Clostridium tagluense]
MYRTKKIILILILLILIIASCLIFYNIKYNYAKAVIISGLKDEVIAIEPELDYVSEDRIIFHCIDGLFVYDLKNKKIDKTIDLAHINSNYMNGSTYTQVLVSKDGNKVYINNIGESLDNFIYEYNIKMNLLRKIKYKKINDKDRYIPNLKSEKILRIGLYSGCYGTIYNNIDVYLYMKNSELKNLQVLLHDKKNNKDTYYYIFEELR